MIKAQISKLAGLSIEAGRRMLSVVGGRLVWIQWLVLATIAWFRRVRRLVGQLLSVATTKIVAFLCSQPSHSIILAIAVLTATGALAFDSFKHGAHETIRIGQELFSYDVFMSKFAEWQPSASEKRVTLINIDDATFREWGRPSRTPRLALQAFIELAAKHGAAVVLVDIDLSWSDNKVDKVNGDKEDAIFQNFLTRYAKEGTTDRPHIIFVKRIDSDIDVDADPTYFSRPDEVFPMVWANSNYDSVIATNDSLEWAIAIGPDDFDGKKRQLFRRWCRPDNNAEAQDARSCLEAAPLAVVQAFEKEGPNQHDRTRDNGLEKQNQIVACQENEAFKRKDNIIKEDEQQTNGEVRADELFPVFFTVSDDDLDARPLLLGQRTKDDRFLAVDGWMLWPLDSDCNPKLADDPLKLIMEDRIVIIGGSYHEGRDFYEMSRGKPRMPGVLILANSILNFELSLKLADPYSKLWLVASALLAIFLFWILSIFQWAISIIIGMASLAFLTWIATRFSFVQIVPIIRDGLLILALMLMIKGLLDFIWSLKSQGLRLAIFRPDALPLDPQKSRENRNKET